MAIWKVAPALAAGCAAILKPSELASMYVHRLIHLIAIIPFRVHIIMLLNSRTCLELADICQEVGLPAGVLNILTGLGPEAGAALSSHPHVDKVKCFKSFFFPQKTPQIM